MFQMRALCVGIAMLVSIATSSAQTRIREVDFKNFTYPLSGPLLAHDRLQWLDLPSAAHPGRKPVHLVNGSDLTKDSSFVMDGKEYVQYSGFSLKSVDFSDLTGEGREEAIVVLHYYTGGTQQTDYVYIYSLENKKPTLLAYCHTGDRADSGLNQVYGQGGLLIFELYDPRKSTGLCCSEGLVVKQFRWEHGRFNAFGSPKFKKLSAR